jgi:hypothetical protein
VYVKEDHTLDLPTTKNPRVEMRHCTEPLTQPNLEMNVEEIGVED